MCLLLCLLLFFVDTFVGEEENWEQQNNHGRAEGSQGPIGVFSPHFLRSLSRSAWYTEWDVLIIGDKTTWRNWQGPCDSKFVPTDEEDLRISYTWPFTQTPWVKMLVDGIRSFRKPRFGLPHANPIAKYGQYETIHLVLTRPLRSTKFPMGHCRAVENSLLCHQQDKPRLNAAKFAISSSSSVNSLPGSSAT